MPDYIFFLYSTEFDFLSIEWNLTFLSSYQKLIMKFTKIIRNSDGLIMAVKWTEIYSFSWIIHRYLTSDCSEWKKKIK